MSNIEHIAHELEDRIMDCWNVTSDIKLTYEEYLDSPESMSEDELSNILIGIEYLYNRKFQRLWQTFEDVCDHGGIWLDKDLVESANQHKDLVKVRNVPDRLYNNVAEKRWDFSPDKDDSPDEDDEQNITIATEVMEQARLRKIQNSVAGRANSLLRNSGLNKLAEVREDDYEHTEEYYDKERNKAVETVKPDIEPYIVSSTILIEWSDCPKTVKLEDEMPKDLAQMYDGWLHEIEIERASQNMSSDGLSDGLYERSIKQKHGRAVQTVSEMMQEELEPLPINTFE